LLRLLRASRQLEDTLSHFHFREVAMLRYVHDLFSIQLPTIEIQVRIRTGWILSQYLVEHNQWLDNFFPRSLANFSQAPNANANARQALLVG
jgi:hypothetical protein